MGRAKKLYYMKTCKECKEVFWITAKRIPTVVCPDCRSKEHKSKRGKKAGYLTRQQLEKHLKDMKKRAEKRLLIVK